MAVFNIIDYLGGLTSYFLDRAVLNNIALERGVSDISSFEQLTQQQKDLCRADIYYNLWLSPHTSASEAQSHGSFSHSWGHQTLTEEDKERFYNLFMAIYKKYDDPMLEQIEAGSMQWLPSLDGDYQEQ